MASTSFLGHIILGPCMFHRQNRVRQRWSRFRVEGSPQVLRSVVCPPSINVIPMVPAADELFNFILKRDTLLRGVTNILMVSTILVLIHFGAISA